jgi:hypothetical protein
VEFEVMMRVMNKSKHLNGGAKQGKKKRKK